MSEILCPLCNAQSPEKALYCQQCGQPIRCKECGTELLPTAQACIRCGKLIPERSTNGQFHIGMTTVPPGYNRLKMHETPEVRDIDLIVHNDAIEHIRDFFPPLVGNRPAGRRTSSIDQQVQQQTDVVEVPSALPAPPPQLAPTSSQPTGSQEGIWQIFQDHEGKLTQERRDLKAASKRDYIIRLVHLYIYARYLRGDEKVPREDVFKVLDEAGVKDTNRSRYISESGIRSDENDLRLTLDGRDKAQQYLAEALDSNASEGWRQGTEVRSSSSNAKKPAKKSSEVNRSVESTIAGWVSNEATRELVRSIPHSLIDTMNVQNRALFALYCLDKAGVTIEIQVTQLSRYLYDAFQIQIHPDSIPKVLTKAVSNKPAYVTYRKGKGSGYRITSSGIEYVERLLKSKQAEHVPTPAEANGAAVV